MKIPMSTITLFAALFVSPFADAAPHTRHVRITRHVTTFNPIAREKLIIAHIKQKFGDYGDTIVNDPRFALDPTILPRPSKPSPTPELSIPRRNPKPKRYNYDYVFSPWSREQGRRFLENNVVALNYAEKQFGVPREVIDGVLNIETQWGKNTGKKPVITTLYTLAVMQPDRVAPGWPEEQLLAFLTIFQDSDLDDLFSIKGSPTGAFGLPQFEPTSYTASAVSCSDDEDEDDPPNLFGIDDTICSIANYLHRAGLGATEASHQRALYAYNHDNLYIAAILDYADWLAGKKPKHPRYRLFHPRRMELAAITR